MYQLVIKNGIIIDGTGSPSFRADVAIENGRIARIAKGLKGEREIDATGLTVTPGFIDSHAHNDSMIFTYPEQREKIEQGITTSVAGTCGSTEAPLSRDFLPENERQMGTYGSYSEICRTMGDFLQKATTVPQGSNILMYAGHSALRRAAMGVDNRAPTKEELETMKAHLRDAMEHGALGLSFGLQYAPSCYADTAELIELAKVVAEYNGVLSAHIRNEGNDVVKSTDEFLTVIRESGARGVFSHHKSAGKENWGKVQHTLRMIDEANEQGFDVYCDVYPYNASHTRLAATVVPKEMHEGGTPALMKVLDDEKKRREIRAFYNGKWGNEFSWIQITICKGYPEFEGKRIPEIAKLYGKDEIDTMLDIIRASNGVCSACYFSMCEEDIEHVISHPRAMICTDSGVAGDNKVYHPRLRGSFPRAIGRYVRERRVVTLSEMIRKITAMPAAVYGLSHKGLLREGMDADICIFDAECILDNATFADCSKRADGLAYVLLSGEVVVENAIHNGKRCGKVLLREQ